MLTGENGPHFAGCLRLAKICSENIGANEPWFNLLQTKFEKNSQYIDRITNSPAAYVIGNIIYRADKTNR